MKVMRDKDDYRMAIFSARSEDLDTWKGEIESFIYAKNPEKANIIVKLTDKPIKRDKIDANKQTNATGNPISS